MSLAHRNLFQKKVCQLLSAVGVALSVKLILVLNGFLSGVYTQAYSRGHLQDRPEIRDWVWNS